MSYDMVKEDVPRFTKRYGDRVIAGSNNSMMVFGTDRAAPGEADVDSGYGSAPGAGSWHVVVGMSSNNPNFSNDDSYIYLSRKTDCDKVLGLNDVEFSSDGRSSAIIKSSTVRIVARNDLKIAVGACYLTMKEDGTIVLDGKVKLGSRAIENIVKGRTFSILYNSHVHLCPPGGGTSGTPIVQMTSNHLSSSKFVD